MRYPLVIILFFIVKSTQLFSWDFGIKGTAQQSQTDNVNVTATDKIKDTFNTANLTMQVKNDILKFKLKGKFEKYKKQTENDYYSTDFSMQYKRTKINDLSLGIFKLTYHNIPTVSSDTSSNNSGARFTTNYNFQYPSNNSSFISLTGIFKNFPVLNRKDKIISSLMGFEYLPNSMFTIAPDLSFNINSSSDDYYKNYSYGPSLFIGFIPNDNWEHSLILSYLHTNYSDRSFSTTVKGRTVNFDEYQELMTIEVGILYNLTQTLSLQAKYSSNKNNSNNSTSSYRAKIFGGNIGFRF